MHSGRLKNQRFDFLIVKKPVGRLRDCVAGPCVIVLQGCVIALIAHSMHCIEWLRDNVAAGFRDSISKLPGNAYACRVA